MAWTIDTAFVTAFDAQVHHLVAENPDQFRSTVDVKTGIRGKSYNIERLGSLQFTSITTRHQDTPLTPVEHTRRRLTMVDKVASEMIDELDEIKMLISPGSDYAQRMAEAYNRLIARTVLAAAVGGSTAVAADDSTSTVTLPSSQIIVDGGTGMTMAKLRTLNRMFDQAAVPRGRRTIAVSPFAIEDLLADPQVTSSDFSSLQALQYGTFPENASWMGLRWIVVSDEVADGEALILPLSAGVRQCVAYDKMGVCLHIARDFQTEMDKRPDKLNSLQIMVKVSLGATRREEKRVIRVDIAE